MIQALLGPIASLASTWLEGRVEKAKAKTQAEVARKLAEARVYEKKAEADISWDIETAKGMASSWKDEWLTILFSIPLIMAFVPGMEGIVAHGFEQLNKMPEWYIYSVGTIVAASFGMRGVTKVFGRK